MTDVAARSITLALSGGGAKCAAQAGVLAVLGEQGIPVQALAGVSAGGLVAALYALGHAPPTIRDYIAETHLLKVWQPDSTHRGLFGTAKVRAHLHQAVGGKTFHDLLLPIAVVAADLHSGQEIDIDSGCLEDALVATMALPGMLPPQPWGAGCCWMAAC